MRVMRARAMGMCIGVRRALDRVRRIERPERVTIFGDLVHNEVVLAELARRGFVQMSEETRARATPGTKVVLITAHGVSDRALSGLLASGKTVIDTTCPLVRHVQNAAKRLHAEGRLVLVVGRPGHVEVAGIVGDLVRFEIVSSPDDVREYPEGRLGSVCQSTTRPEHARRIHDRIRELNRGADLRIVDTICRPTRRRQEAVESLVALVPAVVVVGGRHSNNTRQLVCRVSSRGLPVFHVSCASELDPRAFIGFESVGVTAGASTLPETIEDVCRALARMGTGVRTAS